MADPQGRNDRGGQSRPSDRKPANRGAAAARGGGEAGRKPGDKKFADKKFADKKFGDKKFGDKKFGDKKFADKKSGDRTPPAGRGRNSAAPPERRGSLPQPAGRNSAAPPERRGSRPQPAAPRPAAPTIDSDVTGAELEKGVVRELTTLRAEAAEQAAKHLVMSARLLDEEPEQAYAHAMAARRCGPRVAVIREAVGIAAYTSGRWAEALAELRTARRISGDDEHWPMMADCERALGRPERALAMAAAPEVKRLSKASLIEMRIVAAGARADLGQLDAAVLTLQTADLQNAAAPWAARLRFAYAAALQAAGRHDDARGWYARAAEVDQDGETDAAERLQELDGIRFLDGPEDEVLPVAAVPPRREPEPEPEPTVAASVPSGGGPLFLDAGLPAASTEDDAE